MSRAIVQQRSSSLVGDVPTRTEIGHADDLSDGELELHFDVNPSEKQRVIVEAAASKSRPERSPTLSINPLLRFKVSHQALRQLEELVSTGLYGATVQDAARETLYLSLRAEALKMEEMRSLLMNRPVIELKVKRPRKKRKLKPKRMRGVT
jgi:hypothetical protein